MMRILCFVALLFLLALPVLAQEEPDPTPTVDPGFFSQWNAEVFFPNGIRFTANALPIGAIAVQSVTLRLDYEGGPPVTFDIPLDDEVFFTVNPATNVSQIVYEWEVPSGDVAPLLFTDVAYTWSATAVDGQAAEFTDFVQFTDQRVDWQSGTDQGITLFLPDGNPTPDQIFAEIEPVVGLLTEQAARTASTQVIVYNSNVPVGCDNNSADLLGAPCNLDLASTIYERSGLVPLQARTGGLISIARELTRHLVPVFYAPDWGAQDVPAWFPVGLARLVDTSPDVDLLAPSLLAVRNARVLSLQEMATRPGGTRQVLEPWEGQAYGMVLYMADQYGIERVYQLARDVDEFETFAEAYESVLGEPLIALIPSWSTWIFLDKVPALYGVSLYAPPTDVPTRTQTPSPFPPTQTLIPTQTATATPTATVTGVLSPTPTPTATPSQTVPPPTATFTPRPASSVFTPTPVPTPEPTLAEQLPVGRDTLVNVFLGMMLASVVVLLLAFVGLRRRGG